MTLTAIAPASSASEHKISVFVTLKSGAGVASTVIEVSAGQLLESITIISYTPGAVTAICGVDWNSVVLFTK